MKARRSDGPRTVVITGAAGFLGRHFYDYYVEAGDTVFACDDYSNAVQTERPIPRLDAVEFFHLFDQPVDIAYHFAAPVGGRLKIEKDPLFNADSLRLDSEFFRWAVKRTKVAIYPSSSAVYAVNLQVGSGAALREDMFRPVDNVWGKPDEMYGFTKMAGEVLAWKAAGYNLNTLCIRPFSGYGEGQSLQYPVPSILLRALHREDPLWVWGRGTQKRDFIHVDDLVAATVARLDAGVFGYETLNIGSGTPTSFISLARTAAQLVNYSPIIDVDGTKPQGVESRYCDNTRMLKYHRPKVSLKDGLERVLEDLDHAENRLD